MIALDPADEGERHRRLRLGFAPPEHAASRGATARYFCKTRSTRLCWRVRLRTMEPRYFLVSRRQKAPLVEFIRSALDDAGCRILHEPDRSVAPYRFTFETPAGERLGILVYAFFANSQLTKNRPSDEHRFQVKYGPDTKTLHRLWQDPYLLYTTLFCGIDPERGIFVGADPILHNPPSLSLTIRYRDSNVADVLHTGWSAWEYEPDDGPIEILVGGVRPYFLNYVLFEQAVFGQDAGHRHLLAERFAPANWRAGNINSR